MLKQQTLKGHCWEELRPALPLVLYGSVGATHQSGIVLMGCFAKIRQGSSMSSMTLSSCLDNHEPSLKDAVHFAGRPVTSDLNASAVEVTPWFLPAERPQDSSPWSV